MSNPKVNLEKPESVPKPWVEWLRGAVRYWETRRIIYNLVLVVVTVMVSFHEFADFFVSPSFRTFIGMTLVFGFFACLANLLYCAAYLPEMIVSLTPLSRLWSQSRWVIFTGGTVMASVAVVVVLYIPHQM